MTAHPSSRRSVTHRLRPLPVHTKLHHGESARSYARRLAAHNALTVDELAHHLGRRGTSTSWSDPVLVERSAKSVTFPRSRSPNHGSGTATGSANASSARSAATANASGADGRTSATSAPTITAGCPTPPPPCSSPTAAQQPPLANPDRSRAPTPPPGLT